MSYLVNIRDQVVGYAHYSSDKARNPVTVDIRIQQQEGEWETVNHQVIVNPLRFSMVCAIWQTNMNDIYWSSPSADPLKEIYKFNAGWNNEKLNRLIALEKYHLNDMKAGCIHQVEDNSVCAESGYRWGSAWLVEPLPQSVIDEVKDLFNVG